MRSQKSSSGSLAFRGVTGRHGSWIGSIESTIALLAPPRPCGLDTPSESSPLVVIVGEIEVNVRLESWNLMG